MCGKEGQPVEVWEERAENTKTLEEKPPSFPRKEERKIPRKREKKK